VIYNTVFKEHLRAKRACIEVTDAVRHNVGQIYAKEQSHQMKSSSVNRSIHAQGAFCQNDMIDPEFHFL
jgi:hypothetical protein